MSVVLAVEPDSSQAEALRKALRRVDAELMLVSTTRAAISAMGKSVPDLILVSALLSPRDEDALIAHLRSLDGSSHIQTLTIPQLRRGKASTKKTAPLGRFRKKTPAPEPAGCDPAVFAEQVSGYLARAHEMQRQFAEMALARANDPPVAIRQFVQPLEVERRVESEQPNLPEPLVAIEQTAAIVQPVAEDAIRFEAHVVAEESVWLPDAAAASLPKTNPDSVLKREPTADHFARWRTPSEGPGIEQPSSQPKDDSWIDLDVEELALEQLAPERLEIPLTVEEVQAQLSAEIARFEEKAQQRREVELVRAQAEAQVRLTAEVERVQAEGEARRQHELARVHAEAEAQRHAAVTEARAAAESEARSALRAELEQVRLNELARVQAEADQRCDAAARQARETAQAEAARVMVEELARIRAEVEQTLNSQLAQARVEAEQMREAEVARAQAEAGALRDARLAAEAAASRALEAEVARVRTDADARLQVELETIRREAEHLRRADRSEANQAAEKVRAAAVHDARAIAEAANQTLEAELLRVRAEADARLEAEVARARTQAERQRATELEEIRAQVSEMRETASQQARRAAAQAIASEVVRGAAEVAVEPIAITPAIRPPAIRPPAIRPVEPQPAATSVSDYYSLWKPPVVAPVAELPPESDNADTPKTVVALIRSKWALPVAAAILLVVGNGISVGWSWRPRLSNPAPAHAVVPVRRAAAPVAREVMAKTGELNVETDPPGVRVLLDGTAAGRTPLMISKLKPGSYTLVLESDTGTLTRKVVVRAGETMHVAEGIFSGWLAVFAGVPLNIYIGGRLRGTTEDGQLMLTAGSYVVELVSERFNYREMKNVTIKPGRVASYTVSLPTSVIRINSPDGTDISIDGQATGRTPLGDLAVPIGTHEVVGTSAELGQRRQSIEVKLGEPAEVTLK
jgi:PEGA domain-containing protein